MSGYLRTEQEASATAIARDTGLNRATVSKILSGGPEFESRRNGRSVVYRLRESDNDGSVHMHTSDAHLEKGSVHEGTSYRHTLNAHIDEGPVQMHTSSVPMHTSDQPFFDDEDERLDSLAGG